MLFNISGKMQFIITVSSRLWPVRPLLWKSNLLTPLTMSSLRFKTRKVSHLTNKDWSLLVSNWKTVEPCLTTTSKRNPLYTWSWDWEVVSLNHPWRLWLLSTTVKSLFAVSVTPDCHQELLTVERESVVTPTNCVQRRSWNRRFTPFQIFFPCLFSKEYSKKKPFYLYFFTKANITITYIF